MGYCRLTTNITKRIFNSIFFKNILYWEKFVNSINSIKNKFYLGDASSTSYEESYELPTLVGLIEICRNEMLRGMD